MSRRCWSTRCHATACPPTPGRCAGRGTGFNLSERLTVLWDYFNPSFLFFAGGSNPTMATRQAGVFLLPIAIFLLIGIYALIKERSRAGMVLLAVFVAAPVPIALTMPDAPSYSIARAFTLVPFGVLIAAAGCVHVFRHGTPADEAGRRGIAAGGADSVSAVPGRLLHRLPGALGAAHRSGRDARRDAADHRARSTRATPRRSCSATISTTSPCGGGSTR